MMRTSQSAAKNEQGLVSIMVTMFIMVVITIVVLAFAQVARREQRQALDRQLSTQAFYAAESGVNAAIAELRKPANANMDKQDCAEGTGALSNYVIDSERNIHIACVLIDSTPGSLVFDRVISSQSTVFSISGAKNDSGVDRNINSIEFSWQGTSGADDVSGCPPSSIELVKESEWDGRGGGEAGLCDPGLLRVDIVPVNGSTVSRDSLLNSVMTVFLYPQSGAGDGEVVYDPTDSGAIARVSCNNPTPFKCSVTIGRGSLNAEQLYVRMRSIYKDSSVTVRAFNAADGSTPLLLGGAQKLIDSTGRAGDVLRRIAVRVPISRSTDPSTIPDFALQSAETICKKFTYVPGDVPDTESLCAAAP